MIKHSLLQVFCELDCLGTQADVYYYKKLPSAKLMQQLAYNSSSPATVFYSKPSEEKQSDFIVRIFNQTQEIQFCGHGFLALAKVLKQQDCFINDELLVSSPFHTFVLKTKENNQWVGFEPIPITKAMINSIDMSAFSSPAQSASLAGDDNGYLILEWSMDFDLSSLEVNSDKLIATHSRSVIATQQSSSSENDFDFNLRYFPPQYGVDEDPATGSANRVLASYWQPRLNKNTFKARQLSSAGAVIFSKIEKQKVWISGKVKQLNQ